MLLEGTGIVSSIRGLEFCPSTDPALQDGRAEDSLWGRQGQKEWKWTETEEENPSHGTGEMHNSGRQALSLSLTGTAEVFICLWGRCDPVCWVGWEVDLEKFRGKGWGAEQAGTG